MFICVTVAWCLLLIRLLLFWCSCGCLGCWLLRVYLLLIVLVFGVLIVVLVVLVF